MKTAEEKLRGYLTKMFWESRSSILYRDDAEYWADRVGKYVTSIYEGNKVVDGRRQRQTADFPPSSQEALK